MGNVGRLAGAILAGTEGCYFLVGNTKEPCDWAAAGFEPPGEIDALARPYLKLSQTKPVSLGLPRLTMPQEGEALAKVLASRFVIERTGSISERLWRLVTKKDLDDEDEPPREVDARWLAEMPDTVWSVVRSVVLKCT